MQCNDVRQQLQTTEKWSLRSLSADLKSHLADCAGCQEYAEDLQYRDLLRDLPAPAPREGFAREALDKAWAARDGGRTPLRFGTGWALASAFALVLGLGVVLNLPGPATTPVSNGQPVQMVEVAPYSVRNVDLLMVSAEALPDAWIILQLGDNVSLDGYPGHDRIRWAAPMVAGNNQLTLPVQLRGDSNGSIVVEVESGGTRKQMLLTVQAASPSVAQVAMI